MGALVLVVSCRKSGQANESDAAAGGTGGSASSGTAGAVSGGGARAGAGGATGAGGTAGSSAGRGGAAGGAGNGGSATGGGAAGTTGGAAGGGGAAGTVGGAAGAGGGAGTGGTAAAMTCDGFPIPSDHVAGGILSYDPTTAAVAVDKVTGLAWQRLVTGNEARWGSASQYCATLTLDGESGWRVPSALELSSIVDFLAIDPLGINPTIDTATFPDTPATWFVTSTGVFMDGRRVGGENYWRTVDFATGLTLNGMPPSGSVRCVRTATARRCYPADGRFTPTSFAGVEAVADAATGLAWQKGVSPTKLAQPDAFGYCYALGGEFRVPQAKELLSLVVWKTPGVPIDTAVFPGTPAGSFWSASGVSGSATEAVTVNFTADVYAAISRAGRNTPQYVRCVR